MSNGLHNAVPEDREEWSREIYRIMFVANPQPMWLYDVKTLRILDVNKAAVNYYSCSREKFLQLTTLDICPQPEAEKMLAAVEWIKVHGRTSENSAGKEHKKHGIITPVQIRDNALYVDGQQAEILFSTEISAILIAQKERISSLEKLREAQTIAQIGYWCRKLNEDISEWSDEMFEIFGRNPDTFIPTYENLVSCIHPDDRHLLDEETFLILAEKGTVTFEHRIITAGGEVRWIYQRLKIQNSFNGSRVEIMGVVQNITEKRKADEKFKAIFEHTRDAILIGDDAGSCLDFNDAAVMLFGYSRKELMKISMHQLFRASGKKLHHAIWQKFLDGKILNGTMKLHRKDGSVLLVKFNSKPDILPGVHLCIINDITESIKKTKQLLESERRFSALVQEGADLISIISVDGIYQFISESSYPVLGIKPKELLGKNVLTYIHPDDQGHITSVLSQLFKNKRVRTNPFRFSDSKGEWRWITATCTNLTDDQAVKGIVINAKDITDTITKAEALKLSNEQYKIIMKAANEAIYDWDIEKDRVEWGGGFHDVFGYDLTFYNNMLLSENIYYEDKDRIQKELAAAVKDKNTEMILNECRFHKANGEVVLVEFRIIFMRNADGTAIRAIGSLRDITNYKESLLKIQEQNEKLKEIAWQQSHIVRAPLTRIMALIDLIKNYENSETEKKDLLDRIITSAYELDHILREITVNAQYK